MRGHGLPAALAEEWTVVLDDTEHAVRASLRARILSAAFCATELLRIRDERAWIGAELGPRAAPARAARRPRLSASAGSVR